MILLLQLNGDLPEIFAGHERRLYVLTCRRKTCRRKEGSVRILRGVRITEVAAQGKAKQNYKVEVVGGSPEPRPALNIGETLFGAKPPSKSFPVNPFSTSSFSANPTTSSNPFSTASELAEKPPQLPTATSDLPRTFVSALSLNNDPPKFKPPPPPPEPWPPKSELPPAYPLYYLVDADYEILDKIEDPPIPTQTIDIDEGAGSRNQKEDREVYESTIDRTFQKFADRLAQNPEQVIRYEFNGKPLLYSNHDAVGKLLSHSLHEQNVKVSTTSGGGNRIPPCGNCGARRVFEVQLTPHAIIELEAEEMSLDGMEWGTIIVAVCEKDCQQEGIDSDVGYVEEWAGVQWEEIGERR